MPEAQSTPLVTELQQFSTQPAFTHAHAWRPGYLVLWDNRSAIHKATAYDEVNDRRIMHRVSLAGDVPV